MINHPQKIFFLKKNLEIQIKTSYICSRKSPPYILGQVYKEEAREQAQ